MLVQVVHGHAGSSHAKVWTHPLGPVAHIRQLIHDVREAARAGLQVESGQFGDGGSKRGKGGRRGGNQQDEAWGFGKCKGYRSGHR